MIQFPHNFSPQFPTQEVGLVQTEPELKQAAKDFEAAFISQMLTFSGLGEALVSGEGKMASAFTGFFIEALSEDLAETGSFGLAEKFYETLKADGDL